MALYLTTNHNAKAGKFYPTSQNYYKGWFLTSQNWWFWEMALPVLILYCKPDLKHSC